MINIFPMTECTNYVLTYFQSSSEGSANSVSRARSGPRRVWTWTAQFVDIFLFILFRSYFYHFFLLQEGHIIIFGYYLAHKSKLFPTLSRDAPTYSIHLLFCLVRSFFLFFSWILSSDDKCLFCDLPCQLAGARPSLRAIEPATN